MKTQNSIPTPPHEAPPCSRLHTRRMDRHGRRALQGFLAVVAVPLASAPLHAQCAQATVVVPTGTSGGAFDVQARPAGTVELARSLQPAGGPPTIGVFVVQPDGSNALASSARLPAVFAGSSASQVILQGDLLVAGFPDAVNGGAVVAWRRGGSNWSLDEIVTHPGVGSEFGYHLALDGGRLAIGDPALSEVHVYQDSPSGWTHIEVVTNTGNGPLGLAGSTLVVGTRDFATTAAMDRVRIYEDSGSGYVLRQRLGGAPGTYMGFGAAIAFDGATLVVGDPVRNSLAFYGQVHVYGPSVLGWVNTDTLTAPTSPPSQSSREFGARIDLEGDSLVATLEQNAPRALRFQGAPGSFLLTEVVDDRSGTSTLRTPKVLGERLFLAAEGESVEVIDLLAPAGSVVVGCAGGVNSAGHVLTLEHSHAGQAPDAGDAVTMFMIFPTGTPGAAGVFLVSGIGGAIPLGGSTLCLGAPVLRLGPGILDPFFPPLSLTQVYLNLDYQTLPYSLAPGTSLHFQYWYRDTAGSPMGNLSSSIVVRFCG